MTSTGHLMAVGTFNTPELFIVRYVPSPDSKSAGELELLGSLPDAVGTHSWLALDDERRRLYATCWSEPPCVAAYDVTPCSTTSSAAEGASSSSSPLRQCKLLGTARTRARSGYVKAYRRGGASYLVSISGPSGEIWRLDSATGAFADTAPSAESYTHVQDIDFLTGEPHMRSVDGSTETVPTGLSSNKASAVADFGGLRHGAHGVEFSPEGDIAYVPDIGRNCVWVYAVRAQDGCFELLQKCAAPRPNDGPRHTWSHPNGKVVYSLQEHTSIVDVFELVRDGAGADKAQLEWRQAAQILPQGRHADAYWADEVRLSPASARGFPEYLIASTRGLDAQTKGYVSVYSLDEHGYLTSPGAGDKDYSGCRPNDIFETPTSGGLANAVEPLRELVDGECHFALTDSEQGLLLVLKLQQGQGDDDVRIVEAARLPFEKLGDKTRGLATAVWL